MLPHKSNIMRTIEIKAYQFKELDEKTKQKVIQNNAEINVKYDWWECTYDTFKEVGVKIEGFDIYRGESEIQFYLDHTEVASKIIETFGESTPISITCKNFMKERDALVKKYGEGNEIAGYSVKEELYDEFDEEEEEIILDFAGELNADILEWLTREFEWLTSEESIIEAIEENEYEFTEEGKLI